MDVTPMVRAGQQIIQSYAGGRFRISSRIYESAVLVWPDGTDIWQAPHQFKDLEEKHFQPLIDKAGQIDVVLLGCGQDMAFLPRDLKASLKERGLPVDTMDTGAACRTYNVLMAEGRRVVAAMLLMTNT